MSAEKTTVLITGAGRGLGRGLTETYLQRPNHIVIAAVRDPSAANSTSLKDTKTADGTSLLLVKIDSTSGTDPSEAIKTIKAAGISALDIVIANAGIANIFARVEDIKIADLREFVEVNAVGPLRLLQATYPLLKETADRKGPGVPKFLEISSNAASIIDLEANEPFLLGSYGASKILINYLVRRSHFETPWLTAFMMNPGFIQTDMGNAGAKLFGMEKAVVPVQESVDGIIKKIDGATRKETSGNFYNWDGTTMPF